MGLLDVDSLTLGEVETIEDETGLLIEELMNNAAGKSRPPTRVLRCLVWVVQHRNDPTFTMEQARGLNVDEMNAILDTKPSAGEARRTKKPATADPSVAAIANA